MSEPVYSRAPNVVWRLAPDRVLVRSVGLSSPGQATDLLGLVAVIWLLLDDPASSQELMQRLADADDLEPASEEDVELAIVGLSEEGLVESGS